MIRYVEQNGMEFRLFVEEWLRLKQQSNHTISVFLFSTKETIKTRIRNGKHLFAIASVIPVRSITFARKFTAFLNRQMNQGERDKNKQTFVHHTFANGFLIFFFCIVHLRHDDGMVSRLWPRMPSYNSSYTMIVLFLLFKLQSKCTTLPKKIYSVSC